MEETRVGVWIVLMADAFVASNGPGEVGTDLCNELGPPWNEVT